MNNSVLAGLAVTAHNNSLTNVATFNSVLLEAGPQVTPPSDLANEMTWQTTWPLPQLNVAGNLLRPAMGWNSWFVVGGPGASESLCLFHRHCDGDKRPSCRRLQICQH